MPRGSGNGQTLSEIFAGIGSADTFVLRPKVRSGNAPWQASLPAARFRFAFSAFRKIFRGVISVSSCAILALIDVGHNV